MIFLGIIFKLINFAVVYLAVLGCFNIFLNSWVDGWVIGGWVCGGKSKLKTISAKLKLKLRLSLPIVDKIDKCF